MQTKHELPAMCADCTRNRKKDCRVIKDPWYFWQRYQKCFAHVISSREEEKIKQDIVSYAKLRLG